MAALRPHEVQSPFLRLPAEVKLLIYSYLIPTERLYIDLCSPIRPEQSNFTIRKRSVISSILAQALNLETITRTNGLHMLLVCKRTRSEILPILAKSTVRFHCSKCFDELLRNLSHGLGVGVTWMKHVEIVLDLTTQMSGWHRLTMEIGKTSARETMSVAQKTAWLWYGRLDLMGKERWTYEPMNEKDEVQGQMQPAGAQPQGHFTGANHPHHPHATAPQMHPLRIPEKWLISGWFNI